MQLKEMFFFVILFFAVWSSSSTQPQDEYDDLFFQYYGNEVESVIPATEEGKWGWGGWVDISLFLLVWEYNVTVSLARKEDSEFMILILSLL